MSWVTLTADQWSQITPDYWASLSVTAPGAANNVTQVNYTYYDGTGTFGNLGDLCTVVNQTWDAATSSWVTTGATLYRYYQNAAGGIGFKHGLKFVVQPATYQQMVADGHDPLTVSDAIVADYADFYFEYNNTTDRRVSLEAVDGGGQTYNLTYTDGPSGGDFNSWERRAVENSPDGSQRIVYTNKIGQVMLRELNDGVVDTANRWIHYYLYDGSAHETFHCLPSSIDMSASPVYNDSYAALAVALNSSAGLVRSKIYYSSTDPITDGGAGTGSGAVTGYLQYEQVQEGYSAPPVTVTLKYLQYTTNAVGLATIYPVAKSTVYRDDAGTEPITTSFAFTWPSGSNQPSQIITTYPTVTTAQNGSNSATSRTEIFDNFGNRIWELDPREFINYQACDTSLGVVTRSIRDFNTAASNPGVPACPWTTISGGGLNLIDDFFYDLLGREVESLGPVHTVDLSGTATAIRTVRWTVYQDDLDQVWSAEGYQTTDVTPTVTLVNPVSISQFDDGGRSIGQIAVTRSSTSGPLLPTDSLPQTSYVRWSTSIFTLNDLTATRLYFNIPSSGTGTSGTNYNERTYGYDSMNRGNKTVTPSGTIVRTVHDLRDHVLSTWVGTDDTGATDTNPAGSGYPNNMLCVTENLFDGGAPGLNGILTQETDHVDSVSGNDRVLMFGNDWRDRQISVVGALSYCILRTYDNLDHVIQLDRLDTSISGTLLARNTVNFDNMGRVYQAAFYQVVSGMASNPQTGNTWYDAVGNVLMSEPAGSNAWTKMTYDGVGRTTKSYVGYSTATINYAEASTVATSIVFEQTFTDLGSDEQRHRDRFLPAGL